MEIFAERLKKLRQKSGYSSKEVAAQIGVGQRAYLYYESAVHYPDVPGLIKLADVFGVSADYLLGRSDERQIEKTNNEFVSEHTAKAIVKFEERLKKLREEKKLRQTDVAKLLGITVRTYQYYEGGGHRPDYEMLFSLADIFDVSIDYLLGRSDER